MIKKIKNIKYSPSIGKEKSEWSNLISRKRKLLADTDWTQLPDVNLSPRCRYAWGRWRLELRNLNPTTFNTPNAFGNKLREIEESKKQLSTEYIEFSEPPNIDQEKKNLHKLLSKYYFERVDFLFSPNLDIKYNEALDIITNYIVSNSVDAIDFTSIEKLIDFVEELPDDLLLDTAATPFLKLVMDRREKTMKNTLLYILRQKKELYNIALQEEDRMLHFQLVIESCSTIQDIVETKIEIEENYGH